MPGTDLASCVHYIISSAKETCGVQQIQFYIHFTYKETESQGSNQSHFIGLAMWNCQASNQSNLILVPIFSQLCPTVTSSTALEGELWWLSGDSTKESRLEWADITGCAPECPKKNISYWLEKRSKGRGKFGGRPLCTQVFGNTRNPLSFSDSWFGTLGVMKSAPSSLRSPGLSPSHLLSPFPWEKTPKPPW